MGSAFGAGAGADQLGEIIKQKLLEGQLAERIRAQNMDNAIQRAQVDQGQQRIGLDTQKFGEDTRQFGVTSGQKAQQIAMDQEMQPVRIRQASAQAADIERRPQAEREARDFTTARDSTKHGYEVDEAKTQHGYRLGEIGAQGANQERAARIRQNAAGQPTAQQQNEVEDSINLIDQIAKDEALNTSVGPFDSVANSGVAGYVGRLSNPSGINRFNALHNQLVGKLSLAQAGKLKGQGQISDKERAMLANAATALSTGMSETDYKAELGKIREQFTRMRTAAPAGQGADPLGLFVK